MSNITIPDNLKNSKGKIYGGLENFRGTTFLTMFLSYSTEKVKFLKQTFPTAKWDRNYWKISIEYYSQLLSYLSTMRSLIPLFDEHSLLYFAK